MPQETFGAESRNLLVALGGNQADDLGETQKIITAALNALEARFGNVTASEFYRTPCFPAGAGPDFVNAACRFESKETPQAVLQALHQIEADFGRTRTLRWGRRVLDLDLIACNGLILPDRQTHTHWRDLPLEVQMKEAPDDLILPHPRLQDRAFVLVPLADIAPDWVHPILDETVSEMLAKRPAQERAEIAPLGA